MLAGQGSNLQPPDSKSGVLPIELPAIDAIENRPNRRPSRYRPLLTSAAELNLDNQANLGRFPSSKVVSGHAAASLRKLMGSLIKKRRKRMRKKKHRKLLKRTRVQRRNKK